MFPVVYVNYADYENYAITQFCYPFRLSPTK